MLPSVITALHMLFVAVAWRGGEGLETNIYWALTKCQVFFVLSALQALTPTKLYEIGAIIKPV